MLLTAVVLTGLGSGLTFASHLMAQLYGPEETLSGTNGARTAGAAIFALGALAWFGTGQELKVLRAAVIPVLFTWFVLKSVVAYLALMAGVFKAPVGRTVLALDLVLAVVYGYFLFGEGRHAAPRHKKILNALCGCAELESGFIFVQETPNGLGNGAFLAVVAIPTIQRKSSLISRSVSWGIDIAIDISQARFRY